MKRLRWRLALLLIFWLAPPAWTAELPRRVLVLDSFSRKVLPIGTLNSAFQTELSSLSPEPIEIHEVFLEMARFARREQEGPFVNFLAERFAWRQPDLVVAMGGPAYAFLSRHHDRLFAGKPVLVAGAARQHLRSGMALFDGERLRRRLRTTEGQPPGSGFELG